MAFPTQLLISYVQTLELAPGNAGAGDIGIHNAFVVGKSIIVFPQDFDPKLKDDVIDSTLFAQLVANADQKGVNDPDKWYNSYLTSLGNLGWATHDAQLIKQEGAERYLSVDKLLLALLKSELSWAELKAAKAVVGALGESENFDAEAKFDKSSLTTTKSANFQVVIAGEFSGNAVAKIGGYVYELQKTIGSGVLYAKLGAQSVNFLSVEQTTTLSDVVYSSVRELVRKRLAPYKPELVSAIIF